MGIFDLFKKKVAKDNSHVEIKSNLEKLTPEVEVFLKHYNSLFKLNKMGSIISFAKNNRVVDIIHILPTDKFEYHVFITLGMSFYKMDNPKCNHKRMELFIILPKEWKIITDKSDPEYNKYFWPIQALAGTAFYAEDTNEFIDLYHFFPFNKFKPINSFTNNVAGFISLSEDTTDNEHFFLNEIVSLKNEQIYNGEEISFFPLVFITKEDVITLKEYGAIGGPCFIHDWLRTESNKLDLVVKNNRVIRYFDNYSKILDREMYKMKEMLNKLKKD